MMVDWNELQIFVQTSRAQSFTVAARQLGVPKSTISRAIRNLEERLGTKLLQRTTRSVALTDVGEMYLDRCERMLEQAEEADLLIGSLQAHPRGRLRIGAPAAFARFILGPILAEFLALYPDIKLNLQLLNNQGSPRDGSLDIVIRPGPLEDSGMLVKPLMRIRLGAFASPLYLAGQALPESPSGLRNMSCITNSCGSFGEPNDFAVWRMRRGADVQELRIESRVSVPDPALNYQLAVKGAGVALLSQDFVKSDVKEGRLVRLLPEWEPESVDLHAVYATRLNASPKVRAFLSFLRDHLTLTNCRSADLPD